jgi:hypothetical protein
MVEQVEWFSSKSGNLLGVIAKGEGVAGWNYVIFKRDRKGGFPVQKVMSNFFNLNATRVDLFLSMTEISIRIPGVRRSVLDVRQTGDSRLVVKNKRITQPGASAAMEDEIIPDRDRDRVQEYAGDLRFALGELETATVIWKAKAG